ncbi:MAG: hypothetical protein R2865_04830 [Deinococcales bacterium]
MNKLSRDPHLLSRAYQRLEHLPPTLQADVRRFIGWTDDQKSLLTQEGLSDRWHILGQEHLMEDRLNIRRSYLKGEHTGRWALILDFAHGQQAFNQVLPVGQVFEGEVVFFSSHYPLRALLKEGQFRAGVVMTELSGHKDFEAALLAYAEALGACPWLEHLPLLLHHVTPYQQAGKFYLKDSADHVFPLTTSYLQGWHIIASSGGESLSLLGLWDGTQLSSLAIADQDNHHPLNLLSGAT